MKKLIEKEIKHHKNMIEHHKKQADKFMEEINRMASEKNMSDILTFMPGKLRMLEDSYKNIKDLEEKNMLLEYIIREGN